LLPKTFSVDIRRRVCVDGGWREIPHTEHRASSIQALSNANQNQQFD
jgi:hypothetical protein